MVSGVAWLAPLLDGNSTAQGSGFILWGLSPLLVSLFLRVTTRDWADLGAKPAIRKNLQWYIVIALFYPVIIMLSLFVGTLRSISSVSEFSLGRYLQTALTALLIFLFFAIFEEVGWRGYLVPKLAALGLNRYAAAALVAEVWTIWHVPYLRDLPWVPFSENLLSFLPLFYLMLFATARVFGEIRNITGSFWPAVLMHGVGNAFGHPLDADYVTITSGTEYRGSISTGVLAIAIAFLVAVVISHWQAKRAGHLESLARNRA